MKIWLRTLQGIFLDYQILPDSVLLSFCSLSTYVLSLYYISLHLLIVLLCKSVPQLSHVYVFRLLN